ncbi:MAG: hypothetical protein FJW32_25950 [Acidobacteria bacterium]|nr:hypothetical protein [Acidobacteriota bacterium]
MLIPTTYGWTLFALVISMICLGSWVNMQKAGGKHRFELFYYDFSLGALFAAMLMAVSLGMMGNDLTFEDNLSIAGKRNMAVAVLAGGVFNLGNMLLLAGVSTSGMASAMPISLGLSIIIGLVWKYIAKAEGSAALLFGGIGLLLAGIVATAIAHHNHALVTKPKVKNQLGGGIKGISISAAGGVVLGLFAPLLDFSRAGDIGLGTYTALLFMTIGILLTTFLYNLYFMNLPVQGEPVKFSQYFAAGKKNHFLGLIGGALWAIGAAGTLAAAAVAKSASVGPMLTTALNCGAPIVAALCGIFVWKEYDGATGRAKTLVPIMLILLIAGIAMVSLAAS